MKIKLLPLFFFVFTATAQSPAILWTKCLGGTSNEFATGIKATSDGGCVVIGTTQSDDGDITDPPGYIDFWIVKLDAAGTIEWQKTLGSQNTDYAGAIEQTSDGGYIFTGSVGSANGDVTPSVYGNPIWIVKLSAAGHIEWQKTYGGNSEQHAYCIRQTADGGYIVAGSTNSTNGNVTGNHGFFDAWILKLNAAGALQWQKCYGGTGFDEAYGIRQTNDGGYIVAAYTDSNDGNITGMHGFYDIWVLKLDAAGNLIWQKAIGGDGQESPRDIIVTADNHYMIAAMLGSNNGDSTGTNGGIDAWVIKLSTAGTIIWQHTYGGAGSDTATGIVETENGFAVAAYTESNDTGDIIGPHANGDGWAFGIDTEGTILWQKYVGSNSIDNFTGIQKTSGGNLILAGYTMADSIEGVLSHGSGDYLVVTLSETLSSAAFGAPQTLDVYPNPVINTLHFSSANIIAVDIYDISGRLLRSNPVNNNGISLEDLASGSYIIKAYDERKVCSVLKVIKD